MYCIVLYVFIVYYMDYIDHITVMVCELRLDLSFEQMADMNAASESAAAEAEKNLSDLKLV